MKQYMVRIYGRYLSYQPYEDILATTDPKEVIPFIRDWLSDKEDYPKLMVGRYVEAKDTSRCYDWHFVFDLETADSPLQFQDTTFPNEIDPVIMKELTDWDKEVQEDREYLESRFKQP